MVVASGSRYMLEVFTKHSVADLPRVRVPEPFNQKNELHSDDQVSRILKYIYGNQVSNRIFLFYLPVPQSNAYDDSTLKIPSFGAESIVLINKVQLKRFKAAYLRL